jgi:hypothetical protein
MEMNSSSEEAQNIHDECEGEPSKHEHLVPDSEIEEGLKVKELQNLILKRSLDKNIPVK